MDTVTSLSFAFTMDVSEPSQEMDSLVNGTSETT